MPQQSEQPQLQALPATAFPIEFLVRSDFTLAPNTSANVLQTIMEYVIPRNEVRALLRYPGRLTIGTLDAIVGDTTRTYPLLSTLIQSRNFPAPARVFVGTTAGTFSAATERTYVTTNPPTVAGTFTYIAATNSILLSTGDAAPAVTDTIWVMYAFDDGTYTIEIFTPNERRHDTISNGSIRRLNSAPQDDVNSVFAIGANTPWLPQDTIVRVQVRVTDADSIVSFFGIEPTSVAAGVTENTYTQIELPYTRMPLQGVEAPDSQLAGLGA